MPTPANHRLSAVSNIVAAGPGGDLGSYGPPTVYGSASAEGEVGLRAHPASPMTRDNVIPNGGDRGNPRRRATKLGTRTYHPLRTWRIPPSSGTRHGVQYLGVPTQQRQSTQLRNRPGVQHVSMDTRQQRRYHRRRRLY
jgi:hypothetical protein